MQAEYVDHMGDDLRVVDSARVSFDKKSDWAYYDAISDQYVDPDAEHTARHLKEPDVKLINYLARNGHWTPFAHPQITIRETVPIFVARQRFKHMIGFTYNEVSRRYVDDTPEFHIPTQWRSRPDASMKQGSGDGVVHTIREEFINGYGEPAEHYPSVSEAYGEFIAIARDLYVRMLEAGIAPEQARMVLPQSMMTSYYVTGSLAAWARAFKQRSDPHAQMEIRDLAKQWDAIIKPLFPVSWDALTS